MSLLLLFGGYTPPVISGTPPAAYYDVPYSWTPTVTGGTAPFTFSILTGSLPPGLTLNTSTGNVSGTPSAMIDPATLFTGAEQGGWWDVSDLSSMWQDSARTTPAALNQPVGCIDDKSVNGNHMTQATGSRKPVLRQDGSGYYYLEFDGVDDWLNKGFGIDPMLFPATRMGAISHITTGTIFIAGNDSWLLFTNPELRMFNGTQLPGPSWSSSTPYVTTEKWDHPGNSSLAIENGSYFSGPTGSVQGNNVGIGANTDNSRPGSTRHYGFLIIERALTSGEIAQLRTYFASKQGRTL